MIIEHKLAGDQSRGITAYDAFVRSKQKFFILDGVAGSGKTSLIPRFLEVAEEHGYQVLLLCTTGRATRILKSVVPEKKEVNTVHRCIYQFESSKLHKDNKIETYFRLREHSYSKTIFIVDEASMLNDEELVSEVNYNKNQVVSDLMHHITEKSTNKVVFIGDSSQLPPVNNHNMSDQNEIISPALSLEYMEEKFQVSGTYVEMKEIFRQQEGTLINQNSEILRECSKEQQTGRIKIKFDQESFLLQDKADFEENYFQSLNVERQDSILICYSNMMCTEYNHKIVQRLHGSYELFEGARVINNKNHYEYEAEDGAVILSGDIGTVLKVGEQQSYKVIFNRGHEQVPYTFKVREVQIQFEDYLFHGTIDESRILNERKDEAVKGQAKQVYLNMRYGTSKFRSIMENVKKDPSYDIAGELAKYYETVKDRKGFLFLNELEIIMEEVNAGMPLVFEERLKEAMQKDPFLTVLDVNYAYAITCHKAQGGQWKDVYVDGSYLTREKNMPSYYRWMYTAITRGIETVTLTNFNSHKLIKDGIMVKINGEVTELLLEEDCILSDDNQRNYDRLIREADKKLFRIICRKMAPYGITTEVVPHTEFQSSYTFFNQENEKCEVSISLNKETVITACTIQNSWSEAFGRQIAEIVLTLKKKKLLQEQKEAILDLSLLEGVQKEIYEMVADCLCDSGISIRQIEHKQYVESYELEEGSHIAVIEFTYNGKGKISRVEIMGRKSNSMDLCERIKEIFQGAEDGR